MGKCFFSGVEAQISTLGEYDGVSINSEKFGEYWITREATACYQASHELSDKEKLVCLQESLKLQSEGLIPFWSTNGEESNFRSSKLVARAISKVKDREIEHKDKEKRILIALSNKLSGILNPFDLTHLNIRERYVLGIFSDDEYFHWIKFLFSKGWISYSKELTVLETVGQSAVRDTLVKTNSISITVEGWNQIHQMHDRATTRNVFIAMAFTDNEGKDLSPEVRDRVKTALEKDRWKPLIVDEIHHNDGIMDKVIASIHDSRFVVAELTHQKTGVYYEAGYAKGRGLPVIHIVSKADLGKCHFDVKHLNLIVWSDLDDLEIKLRARIKATI